MRPNTHQATAAGVAAADASSAGDRLARVLARIDQLNSRDPRSTEVGGRQVPYELAYSEWVTGWVEQLAEAQKIIGSEELRIVARGQHVERWRLPRNDYPEGRTGYLKWREELKRRHAATVGTIMGEEGYPEEMVGRAQRLILKKDLKQDPEAQVIEDALCLVFLQHQFRELRLKEGDDKTVDIVRKTWAKMGQAGRTAALALALEAPEAAVVQRALAA